MCSIKWISKRAWEDGVRGINFILLVFPNWCKSGCLGQQSKGFVLNIPFCQIAPVSVSVGHFSSFFVVQQQIFLTFGYLSIYLPTFLPTYFGLPAHHLVTWSISDIETVFSAY